MLPFNKLMPMMKSIPLPMSGRSLKLAIAAGSAVTATAIGLVVHTGTPSQASAVQPEISKKVEITEDIQVQLASSVGLETPFLPATPAEPEAAFPVQHVSFTPGQDSPIATMPREEPSPILGCEMSLSSKTSLAALVDLKVEAACMPNARIAIAHEGLRFHDVLNEDGILEISVPALSETAVFDVTLPNGTELTTRQQVPSLGFYDRVALQWMGESGLQIHALEFGAGYGSAGHVWFGNPRQVTAVVGGTGGFLMRLGSGDSEISRMADVYTFPVGNPGRNGMIHLSVEAEVNGANCNRLVKAETLQATASAGMRRNALEITMPECGATGDFLVLKNLLEDLTIAQQ